MDFAYDHINQDAFDKKDGTTNKNGEGSQGAAGNEQQQTLNEEIQDAYKSFQASPWGMKLGSFLGNAAKQGQSVYEEASKEVAELGQDAAKGFSSLQEQLASRTRGLSINTSQPNQQGQGQEGQPVAGGGSGEASGDRSSQDNDDNKSGSTPTNADDGSASASYYLDRFRNEAAKRLKNLQKAEDAADEALLRFGGNIREFLRDAVTIAPPTGDGFDGQGGSAGAGGSAVLFESKDPSGKRVIHASRQDAQLHVVHTSPESFSKDPATDEYKTWAEEFDVDEKTGDISDDLAKYPELRSTMEKLVPDKVPYADFWRRYYFLRHGLDAAEARRRDLLKAAAAEDDVGWGDDDDDDDSSDEATTKTDQKKPAQPQHQQQKSDRPASRASSTTIAPPKGQGTSATALKPTASTESRNSNDEKSQADSEASYDVVGERSGVPSQAPSSPKDSRKGDDSDDDWE